MEQTDKCTDQREIRDDDSLIEKCWFEKYKGDSRKWLIRDGSYKKPREITCSTMKSTYRYPASDEKPTMGQRRALLLKQLQIEAANEVIREINVPPTIEKYCTEYDVNFDASGFQTDPEFYNKQPELYKKYPLYSSAPTSFYSYRLKEKPSDTLHGLTRVSDPIDPFKKCATFSKPLSEVLDIKL